MSFAHSRRWTAATARGVYLWAGQGTIDLLRVKFPDLDVDEAAHREAHRLETARSLAAQGVNWAFLAMNWGFPPEWEQAHWAEFATATEAFQSAGIKVAAYVQSSNCVAAGSYADRDWYAVTPDGRRIPYYHGRFMTCWHHPGWQEEVAANARRAIERNADAVFFDNVWMGAMPWTLAGATGGFAGCACPRCREAFRRAHDAEMPERIDDGPASRLYLRWRAEVVAERLAQWRDLVRAEREDALVLANNCDVILRDTRTLFGIDLTLTARGQSALLIENVAAPRLDETRLVANALPLKAIRALVPERPILSLAYERGIGLDGPPDPARLVRTIAEAAAVGVAPLVKASEYLNANRQFTVLTASELAPAREAVGRILPWMQTHSDLYEGLEPDPDVAVYYDRVGMEERWGATAPATFAVALSLLEEAVPFEFVTAEQIESGRAAAGIILVPPGAAPPPSSSARVVFLKSSSVDVPGAPSRWLGSAIGRRLADRPLRRVTSAYFGSARVRRLFDRSGLTGRFLQSPFFRLPRRRKELHRLLPPPSSPHLRAAWPVLAERWRRADGTRLLHLVNYGPAPNTVRTSLADGPALTLHTPDEETRLYQWPRQAILDLEHYAVLEWTPSSR